MHVVTWILFVLRLAGGIHSIQAPGVPVSRLRAIEYAVAATWHGAERGIDPFELVAVARNESDFVEDMRGADGKDCGLTQTRVTVSRYGCRALRSSYWLAFAEAARELAEYRASCRAHLDADRCRLNRYNSGVHYARTGEHGAYYLRVRCYAAAARAQVPVGEACRRVMSNADIRDALAARRRAPAASTAIARRPNS